MPLTGRLLIVVLAASLAPARRGPGVPRPFPGAPLPPGAGPATPAGPETPAEPDGPSERAGDGPDVVAMALGYRGVPYRNGGSDPSGFDCSGFVQYVFTQHGTRAPARGARPVPRRDSASTEARCRPAISCSSRRSARGASHVGLAIGGGRVRARPQLARRRPRRTPHVDVLGDSATSARAVCPDSNQLATRNLMLNQLPRPLGVGARRRLAVGSRVPSSRELS